MDVWLDSARAMKLHMIASDRHCPGRAWGCGKAEGPSVEGQQVDGPPPDEAGQRQP